MPVFCFFAFTIIATSLGRTSLVTNQVQAIHVMANLIDQLGFSFFLSWVKQPEIDCTPVNCSL